jgi:magnesium transporter
MKQIENPPPLSWQRGEGGQYSEDNQAVVDEISCLIKAGERERVRTILRSWPEPDIVELFVALPLKRARKLFKWRDRERFRAIALLSPGLRTALLRDASVSRIVEVLDGMEPEQALDALEDLPPEVTDEVAPRLASRDLIEELRRHGEESAGSIMSRKFVAVPADWTIGQVTAEIRANAEQIVKLYGVNVVDSERRPVGYLKLRDLLLLPKETVVGKAMREDFVAVSPETDQEEVVRLADRYGLSVVPVVDSDGRLIGRILPDRLRQVVREEAEEDIRIMAGLSADTQSDESIGRIVRGRAPWLLIGLGGASLAAAVVGSFEAELAKAAVLASFIPIVMSTAGNAGIQAATVAVQAMASGTLTFADLGHRLIKELTAALANGAIAATVLVLLILGLGHFGVIGSAIRLAIAAGLAEMTVIVVAVAVGATVPVVLKRLGIDPAIATGVFITTGNDILAVLIFFLMITSFYFV